MLLHNGGHLNVDTIKRRALNGANIIEKFCVSIKIHEKLDFIDTTSV